MLSTTETVAAKKKDSLSNTVRAYLVLRQRPQRRRKVRSKYTQYVVNNDSLRFCLSDGSVDGVVGDCCCEFSALPLSPPLRPSACQPNLAYLVNELDCSSLDVSVR